MGHSHETTTTPLRGSNILSSAMSWMHQEGVFFLFILVGTVSGMDPGTSPTVLQTSQLSTIESQLIQLEEQVELLEQENMKDKEEIVQLERITEELKRKVSLLETGRGSDETETEISRLPGTQFQTQSNKDTQNSIQKCHQIWGS